MPERVCLEPGCPNFAEDYLRRRCLVHSKERERVTHSKDEPRIYNSRRWQLLRRKKLSDQPVCEYCANELAREVDHFVAIEDGGAKWSWENLRSACSSCHSQKTRREITNRVR